MTTGSSTQVEQGEQMAVENIKMITEIEVSEINDDEIRRQLVDTSSIVHF